jgi:hypothetical protein
MQLDEETQKYLEKMLKKHTSGFYATKYVLEDLERLMAIQISVLLEIQQQLAEMKAAKKIA